MLKNLETGVMEKELCTLTIRRSAGLVMGMYAADHDGEITVHMLVGTGREVRDWEYEAIFDWYDCDRLSGALVREAESGGNPAWDLLFPYTQDTAALERTVSVLLEQHTAELAGVFEAISGLEDEYTDVNFLGDEDGVM